ncbi:hypothetical protein Syun_021656 [Stephania yunnanensis]|uniref:Uncharacterized protein n=1 Tax=Stephania yunnanensis TaxID=152371 RepID=A0AAP0IG03_9MAGN
MPKLSTSSSSSPTSSTSTSFEACPEVVGLRSIFSFNISALISSNSFFRTST